MGEEMKAISTMLANDEVSVNAYRTFLTATDRLRYFGYVDKKELKKLCRRFNYTDTRSFIKGGIVTAAIIGIIYAIRKSKETKENEEIIEAEEVIEVVETE